jgi:hypothetical protein
VAWVPADSITARDQAALSLGLAAVCAAVAVLIPSGLAAWRRRKRLEIVQAAALLGSWLCFGATCLGAESTLLLSALLGVLLYVTLFVFLSPPQSGPSQRV